MAWEPPASEDEFSSVWMTWLQSINDGAELYFVPRNRSDGGCLAIVGVHALSTDTPELGIWLRPDVHGQRLGSELVAAVIRYVSRSRDVRYFEYPVAVENVAIRRIAEANGGRVDGERANPKYRSVVYYIPPSFASADVFFKTMAHRHLSNLRDSFPHRNMDGHQQNRTVAR
jgi:RimJ/RimL family protein N-acetyltransferase